MKFTAGGGLTASCIDFHNWKRAAPQTGGCYSDCNTLAEADEKVAPAQINEFMLLCPVQTMSLGSLRVEPKLTSAFGSVKATWVKTANRPISLNTAAIISSSFEGTMREAMRPRHQLQVNLLALALLPICLLQLAFGQTTPTAQPSQSDNVQAHLGKGYDALKQDRYEVAVDEFRAALVLDPSLVLRAQFPLAVALFEQHKSAEARKEFDAVRRETGDHPNVLYYLGRLDIETRDFAGAVKNLNQAMSKPPFPDTAYYLGFAYFKQDDLPNAEKWLKEAAQLNPRDSRIPYQLGFVYRKQGREDEAKQSLSLSEDLHRQDDTEAQLRSECGEKLDKGARDEAHASCEKLYHDDDAERLTALGMIYGQHGDLEAALKPFLRAAELSPQSPQVQYNLALTYFQLNRFENARAPLAKALKRWPDLFPLNALYGAVLVKLGEQEQAVEVLRHAHELNPQDSPTAELLYATALKLAEKNQLARQYVDALRYFEEAAKLRPDTPEPHRGMAETYAQMGKPAKAATERQEADRLGNK